MEIVNYFRNMAHSDPFTFNSCWINAVDSTGELEKFLEDSQKGSKPKASRLTKLDIYSAIEEYQKTLDKDKSLVHKLVLQKANTDVSGYSSTSGYWTHLAFLLLERGYQKDSWFLYGHARGRFKPIFLDVKDTNSRKTEFGYTRFLSIFEKTKITSKSL